jgi:hypothetical protein
LHSTVDFDAFPPHAKKQAPFYSSQTTDAVTGRGPLTVRQAERHLLPLPDRQVLLATDAKATYRSLARRHGSAHQAVNLINSAR